MRHSLITKAKAAGALAPLRPASLVGVHPAYSTTATLPLTRADPSQLEAALNAMRSEAGYAARYRSLGGSALMSESAPPQSAPPAQMAVASSPTTASNSNSSTSNRTPMSPARPSLAFAASSAPSATSRPVLRASAGLYTSASSRAPSQQGDGSSSSKPPAAAGDASSASPPRTGSPASDIDDSWAFGGGGASHNAGTPGAAHVPAPGVKSTFVGRGSAGKGATPGYGKRRAPALQLEREATLSREAQMAQEYKHEYAPSSRTPRALPQHTYFSTPSSSFNVGAAGTAGAGNAAHGSQSAIHGLGSPGSAHMDARPRRKKTALIMPGQGSQYVAMAQDIYRQFRSARQVWHAAEEALVAQRPRHPAWDERAESPEQRATFEEELEKSAKWDPRRGLTGSGTAVARGRRGWLRDMVFSGDQLNLTRAENAQPSVLACTLSILAVLQKEFDVDLVHEHVELAAGHGSGVYASLVASGALDLGDAVRLLRHRGLVCTKTVEENEVLFPPGCERPSTVYETWAFANAGSGKGVEMLSGPSGSSSPDGAAVEVEASSQAPHGWKRTQMSGVMVRPGKLEATLAAVEAVQAEIKSGQVEGVLPDEVVEVANVNNHLQVVLSGTRVGVSLASDRLRTLGLGARAVNLPVSGPYHSSLLAEASTILRPAINALPLRAPQGFELISSRAGAPTLSTAADIREDLKGAIARRVMWLDSIDRLVEKGVQRFVCLGPGRACASLLSKELAYRDKLRVKSGLEPADYEVWSIASVDDIDQLGTILNRLSIKEGAARPSEPAATDSVMAL